MAFQIEDGTGRGYKTKVNNSNRLLVSSVSNSLQHQSAISDEQGYTILSIDSTIADTRNNLIYLVNTNKTLSIIISTLTIQAIGLAGGTAPPSITNYFSLYRNPIYTSSGTLTEPINSHFSSGNSADAIAYTNKPVYDVGDEIERYYINADYNSKKLDYSNSIILKQNDSIGISFTSDNTSGYALANFTFFMIENGI